MCQQMPYSLGGVASPPNAAVRASIDRSDHSTHAYADNASTGLFLNGDAVRHRMYDSLLVYSTHLRHGSEYPLHDHELTPRRVKLVFRASSRTDHLAT